MREGKQKWELGLKIKEKDISKSLKSDYNEPVI